MDPVEQRKVSRERIRKTVEQAIPQTNIDTTKVLSDEELEELRRQTDERIKSHQLAAEVGRDELRARIKRSISRFIS